jgi:hypothetical protein
MEFDWGLHHRLEDRLSELADYRKSRALQCSCYRRNSWVLGRETKSHYRLHYEGKKSQITPARIQKLIWALSGSVHSHRKGMPKKPSLDDDATRLRGRVVELQSIPTAQSQDFSRTGITAINLTSLSKPRIVWIGEVYLDFIPYRTASITRVDTGDASFDETDLDGSPSNCSETKVSPRQGVESLTPDTSAPADDSVESNTRKDAQVRQSWPGRKQTSVDSVPRHLGYKS